MASGLLLSVICGLLRGPWGGGLGFPWGSLRLQRLSGELGWEVCTGDFFVPWLPWQREGAFQTERRTPLHTHMSEGSSQPRVAETDFSGHLPYAQRPQERKVSMTA